MIRYSTFSLALFAGLLLVVSAQAEEKRDDLTLLFVQTADGSSLEGDSLVLKHLGKTTLFFSDRPERVAGQIDSREFVDSWDEGKDSFASDPPNATVSVFSGDTVENVVVELRDPKWRGDDLVYSVRVIEGKMPAKGGPSSVFIDIIGMPSTPLSYAGVGRRMSRRALVYGGAAMAATAAAQPTTVVVQQPQSSSSGGGGSTEQKMQEIKDMYDKGLITEQEYNQKSSSCSTTCNHLLGRGRVGDRGHSWFAAELFYEFAHDMNGNVTVDIPPLVTVSLFDVKP